MNPVLSVRDLVVSFTTRDGLVMLEYERRDGGRYRVTCRYIPSDACLDLREHEAGD